MKTTNITIPREEIYNAKTREELIALGKRYGRQSPQVDRWADYVIAGRKKKSV